MHKLKGLSLFANVGVAETYLKDEGCLTSMPSEPVRFYLSLCSK